MQNDISYIDREPLESSIDLSPKDANDLMRSILGFKIRNLVRVMW